MLERRHSPRVRHRRRVGIRLASGEMVYAWTYDISAGGLQILSEYNADVGDEFDIAFNVFDYDHSEYCGVHMHVRIAHVVYVGNMGCYRIGMQFLGFGEGERELYEHFLDERIRAQYGTPL